MEQQHGRGAGWPLIDVVHPEGAVPRVRHPGVPRLIRKLRKLSEAVLRRPDDLSAYVHA